jgi:hypothetical protein
MQRQYTWSVVIIKIKIEISRFCMKQTPKISHGLSGAGSGSGRSGQTLKDGIRFRVAEHLYGTGRNAHGRITSW